MLNTYKRHRKNCEHRNKGRDYRRCKCPIWVDGMFAGRDVRKSLKTNNWDDADDNLDRLKTQWSTGVSDQNDPITIEEAKAEFLADASARKLRSSTIERYKILFRQLDQFAKAEGMRFLKELDTPTLRRFRASWKDGDLAGLKKLERLRAFCRFACDNGWFARNPAAAIKNPKVTVRPTLPFTQEEMIRILATANESIRTVRSDGRNRARQLRALVLLLRYTGLRISDAVGCPVDRLKDGKIWLYTHKTGQHVYCPLPEFVVKELDSIPRASERYWFWNAKGSIETARKKWSESLANLFGESKVTNGHAHRFRDTFAVELLVCGTPIENVSAFLGHASIRVTEKHYSPWVRSRQERAEADILRSWEQDPVVQMETKGTPEVHGKQARPN